MIPKSVNRFSDKIMRKNGVRRLQRIVLLIAMVSLTPVLAGCANFDPDNLDIFGLNEKKKLPGDRKPLFPEGVPGVSQGIPSEFVKGNQPPEGANAVALPVEPARKTAAVDSSDEPKPKPKRKPTVSKQKLIPDHSPPPEQSLQEPPQQSSSAPWPSR